MSQPRESRRTILVTGGCGYLGSRLIRDLVADPRLGRPVVRILDNFQSGRHEALMDLPESGEYQFIEGDLLDPSCLRLALSGVDDVIHLAAIVRTPFSFENPSWLQQVNQWGTSHLVDACLEAGVHRLLYSSSCAVYGPGGPFEETAHCRPMGPYAESKRLAEEAVLAAARRGLHTIVARLGIVYGAAPVMHFEAVANRLAYLAGIGRSLIIYGTGRQQRPLVHVDDASRAIRFLLADWPTDECSTLNIVSENPSVLEIADAIRAARPDVELRYTDQDIRVHVSLAAKANALRSLGWEPQVDLGVGMSGLLDRFRRIRSSTPARAARDLS